MSENNRRRPTEKDSLVSNEHYTRSAFITFIKALPKQVVSDIDRIVCMMPNISRTYVHDQFTQNDYHHIVQAFHTAEDPYSVVQAITGDSSHTWHKTHRRLMARILRSSLACMGPQDLAAVYEQLGLPISELLRTYQNKDYIGSRTQLADLYVRARFTEIVNANTPLAEMLEEDPALNDLIYHVPVFSQYHENTSSYLHWNYANFNPHLTKLLRGDSSAGGKPNLLHTIISAVLDNKLYSEGFRSYSLHEDALTRVYNDLLCKPTQEIVGQLSETKTVLPRLQQDISSLRRFHSLAWALMIFDDQYIGAKPMVSFADIADLSNIKRTSQYHLQRLVSDIVKDQVSRSPQSLPSWVHALLFADHSYGLYQQVQSQLKGKHNSASLNEKDIPLIRTTARVFYRNLAVAGLRCIRPDGSVDWGLLLKDRRQKRKEATTMIANEAGWHYHDYLRQAQEVGIGLP